MLVTRWSKLVTARWCEAEADLRCVLVSATGNAIELLQAGVFAVATEPPCKLAPDRASLSLLIDASLRRTQRVRTRLCRRHSSQALASVLAFATEPPCKLAPNRASSSLLLGASRRWTQGCMLVTRWSKLVTARWCEAEADSRVRALLCHRQCNRTLAGRCVCLCDGAAMQACT